MTPPALLPSSRQKRFGYGHAARGASGVQATEYKLAARTGSGAPPRPARSDATMACAVACARPGRGDAMGNSRRLAPAVPGSRAACPFVCSAGVQWRVRAGARQCNGSPDRTAAGTWQPGQRAPSSVAQEYAVACARPERGNATGYSRKLARPPVPGRRGQRAPSFVATEYAVACARPERGNATGYSRKLARPPVPGRRGQRAPSFVATEYAVVSDSPVGFAFALTQAAQLLRAADHA